MEQLRLVLHGLLVGVCSITPISNIVMILVSGLLLFVLLGGAPQQFINFLHIYPGTKRTEDNLYVYMRAYEAQRSPSTKPTVFFLGTSSLRESIVSEQYLEASLASRKTLFKVVDLTSRGQPFWYGQNLLEIAAEKKRGVVALAVNRSRVLSHPFYHNRDRLFEPSVKNAWSIAAIKNRAAFVDQMILRKYLHEDIRTLAQHSHGTFRRYYNYEEGRHRFITRPYDPQHRVEMVQADTAKFLQKEAYTYEKEFSEHIIALEKKLREIGEFKLLLVDTPRNPALDSTPEMKSLYEKHRIWMKILAEQSAADLVLLPESLDYKEQDFYDAVHLRTRSAMEQTSDVLADAIVKAWERPK